MMHKNRRHSITPVATLAHLVEKLTEYDWTVCTGFSWGSLILLNDSTGSDGAQEYAIVRNGRQIESLTVSWMKPDDLRASLEELDREGSTVDLGALDVRPHCEGRCHACA